MIELAAEFEDAAPVDGAVVLAVSGGSDSMAMLVLFAEWNAARTQSILGDRVHVVTVDHGLRSDSAREAVSVCEQAARLGMHHTTLNWTGNKPKTGVQDAARNARYGLLTDFALTHWPARTVRVWMAHTRDDVAETFLMNLHRGSGIEGLSGIKSKRRVQSARGSVEIRRPLLDVKRVALRSVLETRGVPWIDDPSNEDVNFERVRVRQLLADFARQGGEGADLVEGIARTAARLRDINSLINKDAWSAFKAASVGGLVGMVVAFDWDRLRALDPVVGKRILASVFQDYGGNDRAPSMKGLDAFWQTYLSGSRRHDEFQATFSGCLVRGVSAGSAGNPCIEICREPDRHPFPDFELQPGESRIWDKRFRITVAADCEGCVRVMAKGDAFWLELGKNEQTPPMNWQLARPALRTLPVCIRRDAPHPVADHLVGLPPPFDRQVAQNSPVVVTWLERGIQALRLGSAVSEQDQFGQIA